MTIRFTASPIAREAIHFIQAAQKVYITAHVNPDGDALGSALGLCWMLRQLGKKARVACPDPVPDTFEYLPGSNWFTATKPALDELICVLDSSDWGRIEGIYDEALYRGRPILNIDHHVTNLKFGTVNWIEPTAASTAEIIYELVQPLGVELDEAIATCLLTGIATDTLGFRTSSTTAELLEAAANLMRAGASLPHIIEKTFNARDVSDLLLQGEILAAMRVEQGLIWSNNTLQMRRAAGASEGSGSGIVSTLLSARSAKVAAVFVESAAREIKISFRARPQYNVAQLAHRFGGGGHPQASGCTLRMTLEEAHAQVLPALRALVSQ